ncbi:MAG: 23S rRNA (adenine(2503)-C(2))-methyltransferase RlmN [Planctomycetes bacterium]|nr:23S rRNA (adenine(2503)-C(2))-methyltransferase RlmN [Planctomycetota bacterium]
MKSMTATTTMIDLEKRTVPRRGLLGLSRDELAVWLRERGLPAMRARQLRRWLIVEGADSFAGMTDLPKALREELAEAFVPLETTVARHMQAADGTHKLLVRLQDGQLIECVLIQENDRRTACISTQVGCGMGCVFCASGLNGVERNLTAGEIIEQLLRLRAMPAAAAVTEKRLTNIVVMGMGEPLANLDALLEALQAATGKDGMGIGARHVTISTVGLPAKMRRLADLGKQYHLAVSLHAPSDALRTRIVPTNAKTGIAAILEAADYYFQKTGRQVTFEYVMLGGVNDSAADAEKLAGLLRGRCAHVNLIPFNDVSGLPDRGPSPEAVAAFQAIIRRRGVSVKVRKRKGAGIDAACGQLRRQES